MNQTWPFQCKFSCICYNLSFSCNIFSSVPIGRWGIAKHFYWQLGSSLGGGGLMSHIKLWVQTVCPKDFSFCPLEFLSPSFLCCHNLLWYLEPPPWTVSTRRKAEPCYVTDPAQMSGSLSKGSKPSEPEQWVLFIFVTWHVRN